MLKHCYKSSEGAGQITVGFFPKKNICSSIDLGREKKRLDVYLAFCMHFYFEY